MTQRASGVNAATIAALLVVLALSACVASPPLTPSPQSPTSTKANSPTDGPSSIVPVGSLPVVGSGSCDDGSTAFLLTTATANGTAPTPLDDPAKAGFPDFVPPPACAILWTNSHSLPSYAGLYPNASDADFTAFASTLTASGVAAQAPPITVPGFKSMLVLARISGGTPTEQGSLILLDAAPSKGISSPSIIFTWERILF